MPISRPFHVDQRAARVARIDRRVGLDEEVQVADADPGARLGGDDAAGHGLADAERIADGQHQVAHLDRVGIAEVDEGQAFAAGIDLEHGEVGPLVGAQQTGGELALVGEHDGDLVGAGDHVVVGHDGALRARR